jgi:hypothetical protein
MRKKNDLLRLSAWPRSLKVKTVLRRGKPAPSTSGTRPHHSSSPNALAYNLPSLYHETYLRIIPRDPWRLFSFWEIAAPPAAGEAPRLRLYETDNRNREKLVGNFTVEKNSGSRYISVPNPGRHYRLEYGVVSRDRYTAVCHSNDVAAPAGRIQDPRQKPRHTAAETLIGFSAQALQSAASPQYAATDMTALTASL